MTTNIAAVRFQDGLILYTTYQDTSDILHNELFGCLILPKDIIYAKEKRVCTCNQAEIAEAATWGQSWNVKACRHCKVVIDGLAPFGICGWGGAYVVDPVEGIRFNEPEWWKGAIKRESTN